MKRLLLLMCAFVWGHQTVHSFEEIDWESVGPETLVVLDVDDVLIVSKDQFGHPEGMDEIPKLFFPFVLQYGKDHAINCASIMFLQPERVLVEESTPDRIRKLQKRGVSVIGLTNCQRGSFGYMDSVEQWRIDHLSGLGFAFSLQEMDAPCFKGGIIFSKGYTKGNLLGQFIDRMKTKPKKVLFIDDLAHNLDDVQEKVPLPCQTVQYLGADKFHKPLDRELLRKQLQHLLDNEEWLPDDHFSDKGNV